jgi:phage-related minor tail protein
MQGGKATDVMKALVAEMASYFLRAGTRVIGEGVMSLAGTAVKTIGAFLASAQGNVLDGRPWATPMAQGGVYSHAQYVPMANGGTALVAEAGPEAAVPLVRLPSGNLGVRTGGGGGGGGGSVFNINITTEGSSGNTAADNAFAEKMGKMVQANLRAMMVEEMRRQQQPGGQLGGGGAPIYG